MPSSMARLLLPPLLLSPASGAWLAPAELTRGLGSTAGSSATPAVMQRRRTAASPRAVLADPSAASAARANFTPAKSVDVGVMLLNLGGPDSLENVEPFLYTLFSDPESITLTDDDKAFAKAAGVSEASSLATKRADAARATR